MLMAVREPRATQPTETVKATTTRTPSAGYMKWSQPLFIRTYLFMIAGAFYLLCMGGLELSIWALFGASMDFETDAIPLERLLNVDGMQEAHIA